MCQEHQLLFITSGVSRLAEQETGLEANQLAVSDLMKVHSDGTRQSA